MLSNPLRRALAEAIHKFNEYHFAKYKATRSAVKMRDFLRIVHPKPKNKAESELFKRILEDTLAIPETWEAYISTHGSTKQTWETIMPKMPIMATLRNLRNFCKVGANIDSVVTKLTDEQTILRSRQFPFRFWSAYKALKVGIESAEIPPEHHTKATKLLDAINVAMEISAKNLPRMKGTTFMTADNSGSMSSPLSERSTVSYAEIADLLQAIAFKICDNSITSVFGESFAIVPVSKTSSILDNMQRFFFKDVGHSTNGFLAFKWLLDNEVKVDRILLFSDMQLYQDDAWGGTQTVAELLKEYRTRINKKVKFFSFDLAGYGTLKTPEKETYLVAGWSEKVLNFIKLNESKGISAVKKVDAFKPIKQKKTKWRKRNVTKKSK